MCLSTDRASGVSNIHPIVETTALHLGALCVRQSAIYPAEPYEALVMRNDVALWYAWKHADLARPTGLLEFSMDLYQGPGTP